MHLYLVQHAEAKSEAEDLKRPVTEHGLHEIRTIADHLKKSRIRVEIVYHSGKLRAQQTAEELARVLSPPAGVRERKGLAPKDSVIPIAQELEASSGDVLVVGHLPFLEKLTSYLLAGDENKKFVTFCPAGVIALARESEGWWIDWILKPPLVCAENTG